MTLSVTSSVLRILFLILSVVNIGAFARARTVRRWIGPTQKISDFSYRTAWYLGAYLIIGALTSISLWHDGANAQAAGALVGVLSPFVIGSLLPYRFADQALLMQVFVLIAVAVEVVAGPQLWSALIARVLLLFAFSAICESLTHLCLKRGADEHAVAEGWSYYFRLMRSPWIWTGVGIFAFEMVAWIYLLMLLPLSIAFPATGIQKILLLLFTVIFLRESLSRREWLAFGFIIAGLLFTAYSGLHVG